MAIVSDPGFLTVRIDAPADRRWGGDVPVEVRDSKSMVLKARGVSGGTLKVPAGKYWVGATLPDGQQASPDDLVEVAAGESKEVVLSWANLDLPAPLERDPSLSGTLADFVRPMTQIFTGKSAARVHGNWLAARLESKSQSLPKSEPKSFTRERVSSLTIDTRLSDLPAILEISARRSFPTYVALPVAGESGRTTTQWDVDAVSGQASVHFDFHDEKLNTFFDYVQQGFAQEARSISRTLVKQAESYLEERKSPVRALLAAYVLLRANELDDLDSWSKALCDDYEWLPDGVAIRVEYLAREGAHQAAAETLPLLARRGAPWFRSGVAYVAARAKLYSSVLGTSKAKFEVNPEMRTLIDRMAKELDELTAALDLTQMISVYRDLPHLA
jgi:hypothetical protein